MTAISSMTTGRSVRTLRKGVVNGLVMCVALLLLTGASSDAKSKASTRNPALGDKLTDVTFVAFDLETTGFSTVYDRVIEVGAVKFRNGQIIEQKAWLINPGRKIPWMAQKVHGISNEMVQDSPNFAAIYPEFRDFIQGTVLMAHNAKFDVNFLAAEIQRAGFPLPQNRVVDSLNLFRRWYPDAKSHSLEEVVKHTRVEPGEFHRALEDSLYIFRILEVGLRENQTETLGDLLNAAGGPMKF